MKTSNAGFTLLELIAVIVVLGILAATAIPRFINLQDEAALAAVRAVGGSLESGAALNHAVDLAVEARLTTVATDPFYNITNCTHAERLLSMGLLPNGYTIASKPVLDKEAAICTLNGTKASTTEFVLIGAQGGIDPAE